MSLNLLEYALQTIEAQLNVVSRALVSGDALEIESSSSVLRDLSVKFSQQLPQLLQSQSAALTVNVSLKARLKKINDSLAAQRGGLTRRAVAVESALNMLMPTTRSTDYSAQSARYGVSARQSGAFKVLAA
jgi:hypothetical protein